MDFVQYILKAPVSLVLLVLVIAISIYSYFINNRLFERLILHPFSLKVKKNYYTLLTSAFLHGDLTHLTVNAVFIFYFALSLEHITGWLSVSILCFVTIVLCNLVVYLKYRNNSRIYNLGMSGLLVAILVSHLILNPAFRVKLFIIPATVPGALFTGAYISYLYYIVQSKTDNVNHEPHLTGAIAGLIFSIIIHPSIINKFFSNF
jgi:membrane associated rhomboid family serine protease